MVTNATTIATIQLGEAGDPLTAAVSRVTETGGRIVIEHNGVAAAVIMPAREAERLDRIGDEWESGFEVLDEIGAAFADVDPDEIEREVAKALAEVRAEMRVEREAAAGR